MVRTSAVGIGLVAAMLLTVASALAQQAGGLAGVVRDTSGAVLPGVTVEATSPALIEKVRTVFTDGEGRFSVVDLRPGAYTVTFSLPGFATVRREGVSLTTGFTATVNAELQVGNVAETITVSGAAPVVDYQTVRQQTILSQEVLASLPTGNTGYGTIVATVPGFAGSRGDVGGSRDTWAAQGGYTFYHGKPGTRASFDGMRNQHFSGQGTGVGYIVNSDTVAEFQMETSGMSAEAAGGSTSLNAIPKEGSNRFAFTLNGKLSTSGMQSRNLTDALRDRGLTESQQIQKIYRGAGTAGGPIMRDKVWFFGAIARWGSRVRPPNAYFNKLQGTLFHEFDVNRPADRFDWYRTHAGRLTWQVTPRNKVSVYGDLQQDCRCTTDFTGAVAIEAQTGWDNWPAGIVQSTWSAPLTSRLLVEAGMSWRTFNWSNMRQPGATRDNISILEQSTNFRYGAPLTMTGSNEPVPEFPESELARTGGSTQRFAVSYVTGSHTFKTGFSVDQGFNDQGRVRSGPDGVAYTFLRGVPVELEMYAIPYLQKDRMKAELGVYALDQWAIKRLTLNLGLRYDYVSSFVPAQDLPAGPFVPARHVDAIHKVPEWKDWNPRVGASYDLFGSGRTALKVSMGRFVSLPGSDVPAAVNPIAASINSATRAWDDANRNFIPDCDLKNFALNGECGPISNQNFGLFNPNATRWSEDVLRRNRNHTWDFATEVQHEVIRGMSVSFSYNHNWDRNFRVTNNLSVTPEDYSPYCITAPTDPRLPGGGGYQICGLYDVIPTQFGQVLNEVTIDSNFGKQMRAWDGVSLSLDGRFGRRLRLGGGMDTGRNVIDNCYVVDFPGAANLTSANLRTTPQLATTINGERVCRIVVPSSGNLEFKLNASYQLPGNFVVGALYQDLAGIQIVADYPAPNAVIAPSLGRSLAGRRASATVPLIVPETQREARHRQLDFRLSKIYTVGKYRLQGNVDLYNALNSAAVLSQVNTYGARWRRPLDILDGRLIQVSGEISF